ncbi:hypothetical protein BJ741DRAFT_606994 [Chytriomyces cf. hyalinus JEL632]|nr:hypothetical protein BJ741DRAFT_606994 [Chytriomyces cf. hyalinus JEL632]
MDYDYHHHTLSCLSPLDSLNSYHPALYDLHAINAHPNFPIDMTLDQILLADPMLLETQQHCDMEAFSNIPFAPTPLSTLQTTLDHYDLFAAAAAQECAHQQLYNLTHDEYQHQQQQQHHHHYEHHTDFSQQHHQLMSPLFDTPSSHDSSSITPPLSHSPPPSPPVFLPMSIVAGYKSASPPLFDTNGKTENLTRCLIKTEAPGASPTLTPHSTTLAASLDSFDLDAFDHPVVPDTPLARTKARKQFAPPAPVPTINTSTRKRSSKKYSRSKHNDTQHSSSCSENDSHLRRVGGTSKKRHTLGEDQADILKSCFEENRFLQPNQASELAATLGMSETQVKIWFQNRRAYGKRKGYRRKSRSGASRGQHDDDDDEEEDDWE